MQIIDSSIRNDLMDCPIDKGILPGWSTDWTSSLFFFYSSFLSFLHRCQCYEDPEDHTHAVHLICKWEQVILSLMNMDRRFQAYGRVGRYCKISNKSPVDQVQQLNRLSSPSRSPHHFFLSMRCALKSLWLRPAKEKFNIDGAVKVQAAGTPRRDT